MSDLLKEKPGFLRHVHHEEVKERRIDWRILMNIWYYVEKHPDKFTIDDDLLKFKGHVSDDILKVFTQCFKHAFNHDYSDNKDHEKFEIWKGLIIDTCECLKEYGEFLQSKGLDMPTKYFKKETLKVEKNFDGSEHLVWVPDGDNNPLKRVKGDAKDVSIELTSWTFLNIMIFGNGESPDRTIHARMNEKTTARVDLMFTMNEDGSLKAKANKKWAAIRKAKRGIESVPGTTMPKTQRTKTTTNSKTERRDAPGPSKKFVDLEEELEIPLGETPMLDESVFEALGDLLEYSSDEDIYSDPVQGWMFPIACAMGIEPDDVDTSESAIKYIKNLLLVVHTDKIKRLSNEAIETIKKLVAILPKKEDYDDLNDMALAVTKHLIQVKNSIDNI